MATFQIGLASLSSSQMNDFAGLQYTYHHANAVLFACLAFLNRLIDNQIHEWVETSEDTNNSATAIKSHYIHTKTAVLEIRNY